jgi:transglutaminase-like putative cysteine protease
MLIRAGFRIAVRVEQPTPLVCALSTHPDAPAPVLGASAPRAVPGVRIRACRDGFGNRLSRLTAPPGLTTLTADFVVTHDGRPDPVVPGAAQHAVEDLPADALPFLAPSRFCESDLLAAEAWDRFGAVPEGWARVQAVCDFVHGRLAFGYPHGRPTKTATEALREGTGVCRDFAHLSIAFCRALNVPARYVAGYLGDIGVPPAGPMDFCAWFEAFLGGRWHAFDARYNTPRIGRIVMARGRDAADAAMITSFGPHRVEGFEVWADEVPPGAARNLSPALVAPAGTPEPAYS